MSRYAVATTKVSTAAAGFIVDLRSSTSRDLRVWEVGVFAETAVAGTVELRRSASAGTTPGGPVVPQPEDGAGTTAASANLYTTYATAPTVGTVAMRRYPIPATVGAGVIWTFPLGLVVPSGTFSATANGLIVYQATAAAVTYSVHISYEE